MNATFELKRTITACANGLAADGAKKTRTTVRPPIPEAHSDVALLDITDVCALIRMGQSWVHSEVAAGRFPAPVIRQPRCTRWRLASIRAWLIDHTEQADANKLPGLLMKARAKTASDAAKSKRAAAAVQAGE